MSFVSVHSVTVLCSREEQFVHGLQRPAVTLKNSLAESQSAAVVCIDSARHTTRPTSHNCIVLNTTVLTTTLIRTRLPVRCSTSHDTIYKTYTANKTEARSLSSWDPLRCSYSSPRVPVATLTSNGGEMDFMSRGKFRFDGKQGDRICYKVRTWIFRSQSRAAR